jgi:outer membrane protein assembly factor BamB
MRLSRRFGRSLPNVLAVLALVGVGSIAASTVLHAANWSRFRGENGSGVSADSATLPAEFGEDKNLKWSVDLPGSGKSCPIIIGDKVILTAWTGTGPEDLMRHVLCFDRNTGKELWKKDVPPTVPDEKFEGMFRENGYASHTPATDGKNIYCFFGVSGVMAFDLDGNVVWGPKSVGTEFNERDWGSSSSPVLYKDLVIITAGAESKAMYALNKNTGEEVWKQPADALGNIWSTPVVMERADGDADIILGVGGEMWGVNPANGKLRWHAVGGQGDGARISVIIDGGLAIMLGERDTNAFAVSGGGEGDVTDTKIVWSKNYKGNIGTPVSADGLVYWISNGTANCVDAKTGEQVYQERLQAPTPAADPAVTPAAAQLPAQGDAGTQGGGAPPQAGNGGPGGRGPGGGGPGGPGGPGGGRGGRGGRGGGGGGQDYSSPIIADGKVYFARRGGEIYVIQTGREFKQLAVNKFATPGDFSASPAASDGQLFIRSDKKLYCVVAQ